MWQRTFLFIDNLFIFLCLPIFAIFPIHPFNWFIPIELRHTYLAQTLYPFLCIPHTHTNLYFDRTLNHYHLLDRITCFQDRRSSPCKFRSLRCRITSWSLDANPDPSWLRRVFLLRSSSCPTSSEVRKKHQLSLDMFLWSTNMNMICSQYLWSAHPNPSHHWGTSLAWVNLGHSKISRQQEVQQVRSLLHASCQSQN